MYLRITNKRWPMLALVFLLLGLSPSLQAASLGLSHNAPNIYTDYLDVSYTLTANNTGLLTVSGSWTGSNPTYSAFSYSASGGSLVVFDGLRGSYNLTATLDLSGTLVNGNFNISGAISSLGITDPDTVLLNGNLTAFGFAGSNTTALLDWMSNDAIGALASSFGNHVGGNLWINEGDIKSGFFNGLDMSNAFSAKGVMGDTFSLTPIPLPATLGLLVCGLAWLAAWLRQTSRS